MKLDWPQQVATAALSREDRARLQSGSDLASRGTVLVLADEDPPVELLLLSEPVVLPCSDAGGQVLVLGIDRCSPKGGCSVRVLRRSVSDMRETPSLGQYPCPAEEHLRAFFDSGRDLSKAAKKLNKKGSRPRTKRHWTGPLLQDYLTGYFED
jgi:hypothetical protein